MARGAFRVDLFHRIRSAVVDLPPFRTRRVDIPLLTRHFIRKQTPPGVRPAVVSPAAMARLISHGWEGNGRELQNRVESALALADDGQLTAQDFFPEDSAGTGRDNGVPSLRAFMDDMTRDAREDYLVCVLRTTRGNRSKAAKIVSGRPVPGSPNTTGSAGSCRAS